MKSKALFFLIPLFLGGWVCSLLLDFRVADSASPTDNPSTSHFQERIQRQKGAHIFGHLDSNNLLPFTEMNINWITLVPWAVQADYNSPEVQYFRGDSSQIHERDSSWKSQIANAHEAGLKVFMKPHVWLTKPSPGKWRSDIYPSNETNWKRWKTSYTEFILVYAQLAEANGVEMFCVGTEFTRLVLEKAGYWHHLIKQVRAIYSGKITYASNWSGAFEQIAFWDQLDYIGIQAYFPIANIEDPTLIEVETGWKSYIQRLQVLHNRWDRKIVFTELGYKSTSNSAMQPWAWIENSDYEQSLPSFTTQSNCYQAFFNILWKEPWFEGVHIWQMRTDHFEHSGKSTDFDFTPQGKPAEEIIQKGFAWP